MPAALLAALLLAVTVDPRLAEPLRLLAEVGARDTTDRHLCPMLASAPHGTGGRELWVWVKIPTSGRSRVPAT